MSNKEAFKEGVKEWMDDVQVDTNLRALADIKIILQNFQLGEPIPYENVDWIEEIEGISIKHSRNKYLNKINQMIKSYFELIGRSDALIGERPTPYDLINELTKIIEKAKIPANYEAISRLRKRENEI